MYIYMYMYIYIWQDDVCAASEAVQYISHTDLYIFGMYTRICFMAFYICLPIA